MVAALRHHRRAAAMCAFLALVLPGILISRASAEAPVPAIALTGKAVTLDSSPVPGVKVTFTSHMPGAAAGTWSATTGADGSFSVAVPASAARSPSMSVEDPPGGKFVFCGAVGAPQVSMFAEVPSPITLIFARGQSKVCGAVSGASGEPVPGATVTLGLAHQARGSVHWRRTATTDKQGRYEIANLAAGRYVVTEVEPPAGQPLIRLSTWKPGGVRTVDLGDSATSEENFRLPAGARLMGRVLDETGRPVAGAAVSCSLDEATEEGPRNMYQMSGQWYSGQATTDAAGRYVLGGLTKETYRVTIRPPAGSDAAPAALRGISAPDSGDMTLQDATLYKGGKVVGLVVGPDDKPLAGAEASVPVASSRRGDDRQSAATDAAGKFVLAGLPTGRYAVTVTPPAGSACCEQEFDSVPVIGGLALEQRLKMPAGATVSGTVVGPDGAPVAGATIYTSFGYTHGPRTVTDARGQFKVTGLPSGLKQAGRDPRSAKMTISAAPPESAPTLMGANMPLKDLAAGKTSEVAIRLEAGAAVTGLVTGTDGKPVSGCRVSAFQTLGRGGGYSASAVTLTGADGRYVLGQVPPGKWQIGAAPPAGRNLMPQASAVKILAAGRTETVDIALKGGALITARVATATGQPVAGASLRLETGRDAQSLFLPGMEQGGRTAFTDSTGQFRFDSVPPGTHKVQCEPLDPRLLVEPAEAKVAGTAAQQVQMVARLTGSIRGTVRDAAGGPVGGEFLFMRLDRPEADAKTQGPTAYPDAEGRFRFARVLPGKYNLIVIVNKRGTEKNLAAPTPAKVAVAELRETTVDIKVPAK